MKSLFWTRRWRWSRYTYVVYPLLMLAARSRSVAGAMRPRVAPRIYCRASRWSIAAYNEERHIDERIRNLLAASTTRRIA